MSDIGQAILAINSDAKYRIESADWNTLEWLDGTTPISQADIEAKQAELETAEDARVAQEVTDKASAKAKLIAGEALTEAEADTIVL